MHKIRQQAALLRMQGVSLGRSYVNEKMARDFRLCLADVVRMLYVLNHVYTSPIYGLMIDESQDVSRSENMVLFLRFMLCGIFVTRFYRIVKCKEVNAVGLKNKVRSTLKGKIALVSMKTRFFRGISLKQSYRNRMQVNLQAPLNLS